MLLSCPDDGDTVISHKKVSDSSQLEPRVVNLHLLCIRWAGLSSVGSRPDYQLGLRKCQLSLPWRPIWFPLNNVTAVPPGRQQHSVCICTVCVYSTQCVCTTISMHISVTVCLCVFHCLSHKAEPWDCACVCRCVSVLLSHGWGGNTLLTWQTR